MNDPISFAEFGLDRKLPSWVPLSQPILHLGPGKKIIEGSITLDYPEYNFDDPSLHFPYEDDSVGSAVATHVLEHLADPRHLIREVARVLMPGKPFNILVPHGVSLMYLQDLDHKTPFIIDTWKLLLQNDYYDTSYGAGEIPLRIGANFKFAIKDGNEALVTQLIKKG